MAIFLIVEEVAPVVLEKLCDDRGLRPCEVDQREDLLGELLGGVCGLVRVEFHLEVLDVDDKEDNSSEVAVLFLLEVDGNLLESFFDELPGN